MSNALSINNQRTINYKWSLMKNFTNQLFSSTINRIIGLITIIGLILLHYPQFPVVPTYLISAYIIIFFATFIRTLMCKKYRFLNEAEGLLLEHTYHINALSISKTSNFLASCSGDQYAVIWDLEERKVKHRLAHSAWVGGIAISNDDQSVYTLSGKTDNLRQWDLLSAAVKTTVSANIGHSRGLALSKNGNILVTCGPDGFIKIFDASNIIKEPKSKQLSNYELRKVAVNNDGGIICAGDVKGMVYLYNAENDDVSEVFTQPDQSMIRFVTLDKHGTLLAITDSSGLLTVVGIYASYAKTVKSHIGHAACAAFTPNGNFVATGGQDEIVRIWDIRNEKVIKHLEIVGHTGAVTSLLFDKNLRLYTAGRDSKIMIWNLNGLE